jgi:hypothetical protein
MLTSPGSAEGCDNCRLIRGQGGLQGCRTICVRRIRISALGQQQVDRFGLATQRREHQGGTSAGIGGIDADLGAQQGPQLPNVAGFGCAPERGRPIGRP